VKRVTIHEAKTHLSRLIQEVLEGETIVIAKRDKPLVTIEPYRETQERRIGAAPDLVEQIADDFDKPLEDFEDYSR
jgi:prevent-host-death family protein